MRKKLGLNGTTTIFVNLKSSIKHYKSLTIKKRLHAKFTFSCYMLHLEDKLKEQGINYHFYKDDTVFYFVFGWILSQGKFDDILTSIQRWFRNGKLKLNADKSEYIIRKCKIVKHGFLRFPEDGDYTEQLKALGCYIDCQLTLQR